MSTVIIHDFVPYIPPAFIPTPTEEDNGKYVGVSDGVYDLSYVDALPIVTSSDNGKFLGVKSSKWDKVASPMPTPTQPDGKYSYSTLVTTENQTGYRSLINVFAISIKKPSAGGNYTLDAKSSNASVIYSALHNPGQDIKTSIANITLKIFGYLPSGELFDDMSVYPFIIKLSDAKVKMSSVDLIFVYEDYYNNTNYKGKFILTVTSSNITINYISEK